MASMRRRRLLIALAIAAALVALAGAALFTVFNNDDAGAQAAEPRPYRPGTPELAAVRLEDVAGRVGLGFRQGAFRFGITNDPVPMMSGGLCWIDYDRDGWLDLYVVNSYTESQLDRWEKQGGPPRSALFHNVEGRFEDVSDGSGADLAVRGNGCVAADFDRDGWTDLYVTTASHGALLWNEGDGTFAEGAKAAGADAFGWHTGAAVGDVNGDGWPDLFVAGYADLNSPVENATQGFPGNYAGVRDLLFLSNGESDAGRVTFREVGIEAGLEAARFAYGLGAVFSDFDRDGDVDLYVANDTNPNRLYENVPWPGGAAADPAGLGFRFDERAASAGVADPNAGLGIAAADYDGDGRNDLFVTTARRQVHAAYRSQPLAASAPSFVDTRAEFADTFDGTFTGWGVSWADLDLDTDLDLVLANGAIPVTSLKKDAEPMQLVESRAAQGVPGGFADASATVGLDTIRPTNGRGSAAADYDNDGDVDVAVSSAGSCNPAAAISPPRIPGSISDWERRGGSASSSCECPAEPRRVSTTSRRTRSSTSSRRSATHRLPRRRLRATSSRTARRRQPPGDRSLAGGTRRCWTRSGATSRRRRRTRATSSTCRRRCGTPGPHTTRRPTGTSSPRNTTRTTCAPPATRPSATPRTGCSCTATPSPPVWRRRLAS